MIARRGFAVGLGAFALASCAPKVSAPRGVSAPRPVANAGFDSWLSSFRTRAAAQGIAAGTMASAFRTAGYLPEVIERDRNQTEFSRSLEDYLSIAASDERVSLGRQMLTRHGALLRSISARFDVDPHVVAAVWGLESFYGTRRGEIPVISALATLAYDGRRGRFFEGQLIAALKILQNGDVSVSRMTGSWAGAMGHTQFIPTSFLAYAVDFTGDGRRDIWSDDPADALASTAAYLKRSGWRPGHSWGVEVAVPQGYGGPSGRGVQASVADWATRGIRGAGRPVPDHGPAALLLPQGPAAPGFLVFHNFSVILRYNNAENYAIGVGHLSDRLRGDGPLRGSFPPDGNGLTKHDRLALQRKLVARGYDIGTPDGVIGDKTRAAITAVQRAMGLPVTGQPSRALLSALGA